MSTWRPKKHTIGSILNSTDKKTVDDLYKVARHNSKKKKKLSHVDTVTILKGKSKSK